MSKSSVMRLLLLGLLFICSLATAHENHFGTIAIEYFPEKDQISVLFRLQAADADRCCSILNGVGQDSFPSLVTMSFDRKPFEFLPQVQTIDDDVVATSVSSFSAFDTVNVSAVPLFACFPEYKIFVSVVNGAVTKGMVLTCQDKSGEFIFSD